jgi:hypothetical protein
MTVTHKSYGAGKVVGEWHSIRSGVPCKDIFDVIFQNRSGSPFLHCCRKEYLTQIRCLYPLKMLRRVLYEYATPGDQL